ncbi:MAG: hypothetical protein DRN18_01990 [Thermoplasmata archaeon]|nr:MAG: hypothetical protein DRN18_01990 [Thermoplasmata archaeon]
MEDEDTTKRKTKTAYILVVTLLFVFIITDTFLSFEGILLSFPSPLLVIKSTAFMILMMLYVYLSGFSVKMKLSLLRIAVLTIFIAILMGMFLLPFTNLPSHISLYVGMYGTLIIMLYYYLCKRLSLSSANAKSCK